MSFFNDDERLRRPPGFSYGRCLPGAPPQNMPRGIFSRLSCCHQHRAETGWTFNDAQKQRDSICTTADKSFQPVSCGLPAYLCKNGTNPYDSKAPVDYRGWSSVCVFPSTRLFPIKLHMMKSFIKFWLQLMRHIVPILSPFMMELHLVRCDDCLQIAPDSLAAILIHEIDVSLDAAAITQGL